MITTVSDDKAFIDHIIDHTILESSIEFIKERFSIEEVYGRDTLEEWALENEFVRNSKVEELEEYIEMLKEEKNILQNSINELNE